jgi:hypothetical protein
MAVELIRALRVNRCIKVPRYGFGRPREAVLQKCLVRIAPRDREVGDTFRAVLSGAFPRAEALGYFVEPFHGRSLPFSLVTRGCRCS